jgi:hypothetical protein
MGKDTLYNLCVKQSQIGDILQFSSLRLWSNHRQGWLTKQEQHLFQNHTSWKGLPESWFENFFHWHDEIHNVFQPTKPNAYIKHLNVCLYAFYVSLHSKMRNPLISSFPGSNAMPAHLTDITQQDSSSCCGVGCFMTLHLDPNP